MNSRCKSARLELVKSRGRFHLPTRAMASCILAVAPLPASAHVKWFSEYQLESAPTPIGEALENRWFWLALLTALTLFVAAVAVERMVVQRYHVTGRAPWVPTRFWTRADDFMRAIVGGFFAAIFAIGGVYLTPELHTSSEWVSWLQLLIAAAMFSRVTLPIGGAGILALWVVALRDYDLFHLLDYLALCVGLAGYLVLAGAPAGRFFEKRFTVLRVALAVAVMWSSVEKLAFPGWFYPLIDDHPYLTFGLPRHVFIPMAGAAEFTMALGLLWSPLIRRMSALALLTFFTLAVLPFGRVDLIGHSLIIGVLILIIAEPAPVKAAAPKPWVGVAAVPAGLASALMLFGSLYWGLHGWLYPHVHENVPLILQLDIPICGPGETLPKP